MPALAPTGSRAFFSGHPVFRREEYARAVGRKAKDNVLTAMLSQHLKAGNIRRIARGVYASVPPHIAAENWIADRYLAAAKLRPRAVIAYHSAFELHGAAYTEAPDVAAISPGEPTLFETQDFSCRFLGVPKGFLACRDVQELDRAGLRVAVTTIERTVADAFDRPDLIGGAEELVQCLALVQRIKDDVLLRQVKGLSNAAAAGAAGWWLEREQKRLGVSDKTLASLRALKPNYAQYVLGARKGAAKFIKTWNILLPKVLTDSSFEGA